MRLIAELLRVVLLAAIVVAVCPGRSGAVAATVRQGTIAVPGQTLTYSLYLPQRAAPTGRYPIVMLLHGGSSNGARIAEQTGIGAYVDQYGFIAVLPDTGGTEWNDGRDTTRSSRDDVGYLVALVHEVVARFGGDPARVFVAGASAGGMMVQRLACEATNVFAAYAAVVANLPVALAGTCRPSRRVPIVFFNSTTDPFMPWAGGEIRRGRFRGAGGQVLSAPQTIDFWSRFDGCGGARTEDLPDRVSDNTHVRVVNFGACGVLFYEIEGGGHTWPGGASPGGFFARRILGATTHNINATSAMLDFFRRYGL